MDIGAADDTSSASSPPTLRGAIIPSARTCAQEDLT